MATISQLEQGIKIAQAQNKPEIVQRLRTAMQGMLSKGWYVAHAQQNYDAQGVISQKLAQYGLRVMPAAEIQGLDRGQLGDMRSRAIAEGTSAPLLFAEGVAHGAASPFTGAAQALTHALGSDEAAQAVDQRLAQNERGFEAGTGSTTAGTVGNVVGEVVGEVLPFLYGSGAVSGALKGVEGLGKASPYVAQAVSGAAYGAAQPTQTGDSRLSNAVQGAALGAIGEAVPRGLGALAQKAKPTLSAAKQEAIKLAEEYGIPLHLSQVTNSPAMKAVASAAKYFPFSGSGAAQEAQQAAFNRALASTLLKSGDKLTPELMRQAERDIGRGYNTIFANNTVHIDPETASKLRSIWAQAGEDLEPQQADLVRRQITRYLDAASANGGSIPGRLYQNLRLKVRGIGERNEPYSKLVRDVRRTMEGAAERSMSPEDAKALSQLNKLHSNRKVIEKALTRQGGASNDVSPRTLWSIVNGKYGSTPEMNKLARLGQNLLKDPINDSGTAQRILSYEMLMHPIRTIPFAGLGATFGRALNSQAATKYVPGAVSKALSLGERFARPALRGLPLAGSYSVPVVPEQQKSP